MKRSKNPGERLRQKTFAAWWISVFLRYYSLSLAEAENLVQFIFLEFRKHQSQVLQEGQIWYRAVAIHEPAGKSLVQCEKKKIKLTLFTDQDIQLRNKQGLYALHKAQVLRLTEEARRQGALLTQEDLAILLNVSVPTIKRIMAEYRQQDIYIPTRGNYQDIGPGMSHKTKVIQLFLQGYTETEISNRMQHSLNSIERYLIDFTRVFLLLEQGYPQDQIRLATRLSPKLINEYIQLYKLVKHKSEYQSRLEELKQHYHLSVKKNF